MGLSFYIFKITISTEVYGDRDLFYASHLPEFLILYTHNTQLVFSHELWRPQMPLESSGACVKMQILVPHSQPDVIIMIFTRISKSSDRAFRLYQKLNKSKIIITKEYVLMFLFMHVVILKMGPKSCSK